jgi:WD40 repeat protein
MQYSYHRTIKIVILFFDFLLVGCQIAAQPTGTANQAPKPSGETSPSPTLTLTSTATASITPTSTLTITTTATQTPTNTITSTPTITPIPLPSQVISPENASLVVPFSVWGKGTVSQMAYGNHQEVLIVRTPMGIYLYKVDSLDLINKLEGGDQFLLSPDQTVLAVIKDDGVIQLWDVIDGKKLHDLAHTFSESPPAGEEQFMFLEELGGGRGVNDIIFTPDNEYLIAGYGDKTIDVWRVSDGTLDKEYSDPIGQFIHKIALSPDHQYLVTSGQAVGLWDYESGELLKLIPNAGRISDNPFSSNSDILLTTDSGTVIAWSLPEMSVINRYGTGLEYATAKLSGDGEVIIVNNGEQFRRFSDGKMVAQEQIESLSIEMATPQPVPQLDDEDLINLDHFVYPQSMRIPSDPKIFVAGVKEKKIFIWDVLSSRITQRELEGGSIGPLAISSDGSLTAICTESGLEIHDADGSSSILTDACKESGYLAISENIQTIYRGSDSIIDAIQILDGTIPHQLRGHQLEVSVLELSPDGNLLASGTAVGRGGAELFIWEQDPYTTKMKIRVSSACGFYCRIEAIAISPDNTLIAAGGADRKVKLWRISDGWLLTDLDTDSGPTSLTFSTNGEILAAGDWSGTIYLWQLPSGDLLHTLEGHAGSVLDLTFSEDGTSLFSLSADGSVRLWGIK